MQRDYPSCNRKYVVLGWTEAFGGDFKNCDTVLVNVKVVSCPIRGDVIFNNINNSQKRDITLENLQFNSESLLATHLKPEIFSCFYF